ncbi:chemotaxis protein CheW [Plasticicumulans acidivorans]|uniref:CheW protein n=1 Tax=Plasticicumulans acidivorans TaxID=886464 RepID=A0A317MWK5_9GAMM|nr:chemotaxis protein CheW [Plasticicumulans acidivorans]PWV63255.1 CheW protein [Plasticicumulans acidivorans]
MSEESQFCTFYLAGLFFGVQVTKVQEVIRYQETTPIPLAPATVSGLINLRGQIVTAIDLRRVLGLEDRPGDMRPMNVVIHTDEGAVSLLVDKIGDVLHADVDSFERIPDTVRGVARDLILGAYKLTDKLLLVLDTDRIVEPESAM